MPIELTGDIQLNGSALSWDSADAALSWDGSVTNNNHTTMPNDNRISAEVTAANKTLIMTKVTEIKAHQDSREK